MTGHTHDLAAFTALSAVLVTYDMPHMTLATALVAFSVNMIGGLAPDLDQSTAALWRKMRGGSLIGKIISPLIGGHRFLSHSLIGVVIAGVIAHIALGIIGKVLLVDMDIIWWSFMIGFVSHLIMDLFTHDGVPLLFPIPMRFGIPPLRFLRMKTGGLVEKSFVFPVLIFLNGVIYYYNYPYILQFLRHLQ
jgi:inner membrane protein